MKAPNKLLGAENIVKNTKETLPRMRELALSFCWREVICKPQCKVRLIHENSVTHLQLIPTTHNAFVWALLLWRNFLSNIKYCIGGN